MKQKKVVKTLLWIVAVIIILAFVLWGIPNRMGEKQSGIPKYAGQIFGKKVPFENFAEAYQAARNKAIMIYGQDFEKYAQYINLEEEAWNRLILLHEAKKKKINVSNEEVIERVKSFPFFQKDGKFDFETYNLLLNYVFRVSAAKFEKHIKQSLIIENLIQQILNDVSVSEEEITAEYAKENDTAKVNFVLVDKENFKKDISVTEEEIKDYYAKNDETFKKPKQVNVQYLKVNIEAQKAGIQITDEEIKDYYEQNKEAFKIAEEQEEPQEEKSEIPPAEKAEYKTLEEAKEEIRGILLTEKARDKALNLAYEISDLAYEKNSLEEASKKYSLPLSETGFFSAYEPIPEIGWSYQFITAAFELEKGQISDVVETPKDNYIMKLIQKREPHIPVLEEIKEEVKKAVIEEKAGEKAKERAEEILLVVEAEKNKENFDFVKTVEGLGLAAQTTENFKRAEYIPNIGQSKEFIDAAFDLDTGQTSSIIDVQKGFAILQVKEKNPFDNDKFSEQKEDFKNKLLDRKKQEYYNEWLKEIKEKAELKSNLEILMKK